MPPICSALPSRWTIADCLLRFWRSLNCTTVQNVNRPIVDTGEHSLDLEVTCSKGVCLRHIVYLSLILLTSLLTQWSDFQDWIYVPVHLGQRLTAASQSPALLQTSCSKESTSAHQESPVIWCKGIEKPVVSCFLPWHCQLTARFWLTCKPEAQTVTTSQCLLMSDWG